MRNLFGSHVIAVFTFGLLIVCAGAPASAQTSADSKACAGTGAKEAIPACTRILSQRNLSAKNRSLAFSYRGYSHNIAGDYDRAISDLNEAIRFDSKSLFALNTRGLIYNNRLEFDKALSDLNEVIRLNASYGAAYHNRGISWNGKREYNKAIADFDKAESLNIKGPYTYNGRGIAYAEKGDHDRAIRDYDEAIRLDPKYTQAFLSRAGAYFNKKDYDNAIRDLDSVIRLDPKNTKAYNLRGASYRNKDDFDRAIRDFDEAILLDPKFATPYGNRGFTYRRKNDFDRAIRDYDEAIRLNPKFALAYFHRGIAYKLKGDLNKAYRDIVEAIALNPSHKEANEEREKLRMMLASTSSGGSSSSTSNSTTTPVTPPPVVTVAPQPAGPRVALVIGNGKYRFAPELPNPGNDARDVSAALRDLGFKVIEGYDLDSAGMRAKIAEFGAAMPGAVTTLFFYAGHGVAVAGKNYLVPTDAKLARPSALNIEAIEVDTILADMETEKRTNLVFLDACRDNPLSRSLARSFGATRSSAVAQGLAQVNAGIGTLITFATSPNAVALDGSGRNSPFTTALLRHIRTPNIEVRTLLTRVRADVIKATNEKQIPWDHSSLTGEFYFKRGG